MGFFQIESSNPDYGWVLRKNPASPMLAKPCRQGVVFGYYSKDGKTFNVYFHEEGTNSYAATEEGSDSYFDPARYNSPMFAINVLGEMLDSALKLPEEHDVDGFEHTVRLTMFRSKAKFIELFQVHMPDFQLTAVEKVPMGYSIEVTTKRSLRDLLNYMLLFATYHLATTPSSLWISEDQCGKYLRPIEVLDAPYFVRHVLKCNLLRGKNAFEKFKPLLEMSTKWTFKLNPGNTQMMRRAQVESWLTMDHDVVDVGCGEGFYVTSFARKLDGYTYFAVDIDEEMRQTVKRRADYKKIENVVVLESVDAFVDQQTGEQCDWLLVEVIEHMPYEEAVALCRRILTSGQCNRLICTTPNRDFNQYYHLDEDAMRHDDHKFELDVDQFRTFCDEVTKELGVVVTQDLAFIGDSVDGQTVSTGVCWQWQPTSVDVLAIETEGDDA